MQIAKGLSHTFLRILEMAVSFTSTNCCYHKPNDQTRAWACSPYLELVEVVVKLLESFDERGKACRYLRRGGVTSLYGTPFVEQRLET